MDKLTNDVQIPKTLVILSGSVEKLNIYPMQF